jgi:hypothetical protein
MLIMKAAAQFKAASEPNHTLCKFPSLPDQERPPTSALDEMEPAIFVQDSLFVSHHKKPSLHVICDAQSQWSVGLLHPQAKFRLGLVVLEPLLLEQAVSRVECWVGVGLAHAFLPHEVAQIGWGHALAAVGRIHGRQGATQSSLGDTFGHESADVLPDLVARHEDRDGALLLARQDNVTRIQQVLGLGLRSLARRPLGCRPLARCSCRLGLLRLGHRQWKPSELALLEKYGRLPVRVAVFTVPRARAVHEAVVCSAADAKLLLKLADLLRARLDPLANLLARLLARLIRTKGTIEGWVVVVDDGRVGWEHDGFDVVLRVGLALLGVGGFVALGLGGIVLLSAANAMGIGCQVDAVGRTRGVGRWRWDGVPCDMGIRRSFLQNGRHCDEECDCEKRRKQLSKSMDSKVEALRN